MRAYAYALRQVFRIIYGRGVRADMLCTNGPMGHVEERRGGNGSGVSYG